MQESGEKSEMRKIQNSTSGVIISLYNWNMEIRIGIRKRKLRETFSLILFLFGVNLQENIAKSLFLV